MGRMSLRDEMLMQLYVETMMQGYLRNGLLILSLGAVLFYSAHDAFHRGCSAVLLGCGVWTLTGASTIARARLRASLYTRDAMHDASYGLGVFTALCVTVFLCVETHRGSLWNVGPAT